MLLGDKFIDFMKSPAPVEFLEGTTYAGKSTVGVPKFMFKIAASNKKLHVLSGLDLGTIEKNIINKDLGILDIFGSRVEYNASGKGQHSLPHIIYRVDNNRKNDKIIYVVGYDNKTRWKKVLGGQYGCVFIDEINVADMDYVREIAMRCDYLCATLNPDDPGLAIYSQYINKSRPLEKYKKDYPLELLKQLNQPEEGGWVHWYFTFDDNIGVPREKIEQIKRMVPKGTKQYKTKILGLRGRNQGLIFDLDERRHLVNKLWLKEEVKQGRLKWRLFTCGVDTSYSRKSKDAITFVFSGITTCGKIFRLSTYSINNTELVANGYEAKAPSDIPPILHAFLDKNTKEWGKPDGVYIDSADSATLEEIAKYIRLYGSIYDFAKSYKKVEIIDRIKLMQGWMGEFVNCAFIVLEDNGALIDEHNSYSWEETKQKPEDANDHSINADQYGWIPYRDLIGGVS